MANFHFEIRYCWNWYKFRFGISYWTLKSYFLSLILISTKIFLKKEAQPSIMYWVSNICILAWMLSFPGIVFWWDTYIILCYAMLHYAVNVMQCYDISDWAWEWPLVLRMRVMHLQRKSLLPHLGTGRIFGSWTREKVLTRCCWLNLFWDYLPPDLWWDYLSSRSMVGLPYLQIHEKKIIQPIILLFKIAK